MGRLLFVLPSVGAGDTIRIDTASGSDTPASIVPASGGPAITGAVLHAGVDGALPRVLGPADGTDTLYLKQLNYRGAVTGSPTTLTGSDLDAAPDGNAASSAPDPELALTVTLSCGGPTNGIHGSIPLGRYADDFVDNFGGEFLTVPAGLLTVPSGLGNGMALRISVSTRPDSVVSLVLSNAEFHVWNPTGTQKLVLSLAEPLDLTSNQNGVGSSNIDPDLSVWTVNEQVGADLTIDDGSASVDSTAGGQFGALFTGQFAWQLTPPT